MVISTKYMPEGDYLLHTVSGSTTVEEFVASAFSQANTPGYKEGMSIVIDLCQFDTRDFSSRKVQHVARSVTSETSWVGKGFRLAFVADSDVGFGIARMYQAHVDKLPIDVNVFRTMDEALGWIGANGD